MALSNMGIVEECGDGRGVVYGEAQGLWRELTSPPSGVRKPTQTHMELCHPGLL